MSLGAKIREVLQLFTGLFICTVCVTLCVGCTTTNNQRYKVRHGTIYNSSTQEIYDIRAVHEPTKRVVAISSILPDRSFDLGFKEQLLMANYAVFTWTDAAGKHHEQRVDLPRPLKKSEELHEVIYTIDQRGKVSVSVTPLD